MVTAASEMELFLPKSYDIFWSLVILIIVAVFFYKFFLPKFQAVFDERAAKIEGGIAMAQGEICRPADLGLGAGDVAPLTAIRDRLIGGKSAELRQDLSLLVADGGGGDFGLADESLTLIRDQFRDFFA